MSSSRESPASELGSSISSGALAPVALAASSPSASEPPTTGVARPELETVAPSGPAAVSSRLGGGGGDASREAWWQARARWRRRSVSDSPEDSGSHGSSSARESPRDRVPFLRFFVGGWSSVAQRSSRSSP